MKLLACAVLLLSATASAQNFSGSAALDEAVNAAIREKRIPGAVLQLGRAESHGHWRDADCTSDLVHAHNQLPALTDDQVLALQLREMLCDSGPRGTDQVGDVLVAERYP